MAFSPTTQRVLATWTLVAVLATQTFQIDLSNSAATQPHWNLVAILVDEDVYSNPTSYEGLSDEYSGLPNTTLKARIDRYAETVQSVMPMTKAVILRTQPDEDPANIVQVLETLYFEGDGTPNAVTQLSGVVLIGDLPIPVINKNDNRYLSLYPYTDFEERAYLYNPLSEDFEPSPQVSNPQPEVWHGVIAPPSDGEAGYEQLAEYFDKNTLYRQGYSEFADFEQKFFYADTIAEEQAFNESGAQAYQRFIDNWENVAYYRYTSDLARELYEEVYGSLDGGDGEDNDGDGLTDEDPINGYDDDDDGLVDEDDGNFDYGIDNDRDCWAQSSSAWDSNGDGRPCSVGDNLVDEDGTEDNNNDGDLARDEDPEGDDNGDGCSGKCDTDDDGDQADWDGDGWPNGFEDEVLDSNKSKKRSPFWYKAKNLSSDEQDILSTMYIDETYPTYDPYCFTPYTAQPLPSEYFDGTLHFQEDYTDRNGDRCRPAACEADMSNDDDEDGLCDEDTVNDNDADGDGSIDEDREGDPDGGADMFEELPDIQSKMVVDSFFKKYPELFQKFIGNLNQWTDYTGRYDSSRTTGSGLKESDRDTLVAMIGQRDDYVLKLLRAVNDIVEESINEVVEDVANDIPLVGRITITGEVEDSGGGTETFTYEFINHAVRNRFWYPNQIYILGNSADEITSVGQCSLYRGSYDEGGDNQLVEGNRVYNYETAGDYDEDGEPYGGCFGNFAETPDYCFPELAENPVRSQIGTVLINDPDIHVDYRSCYNFRESEEFLGTTYSASDSSYSSNIEGYWYYAKNFLEDYSDLLEDLDEGRKDDGDDMDGDGDYDEDDFDMEVQEIIDDLNANGAYDIPVKDPDDIYLYGEEGDSIYYTFGAFLDHLDINKDSQEEIGGFFADNQTTYEFDVDEFEDIDHVTLEITKEYIRDDGSLLSSALTTNESDAYTVSSILQHIEPIVSTINKQVTSGFSESLPIDDPRFITFQDQYYEYQEIEYPNVFDVATWEEFSDLLESKESEITDSVPGASSYSGFLSELLGTEIFESQLSDALAWREMNIDEKHLWAFQNYLSTESEPYVGLAEEGYEMLYLVAEGESDAINMSFFDHTVGEDPDLEFSGEETLTSSSDEADKAEAAAEESYDVNDPDSGHISWFPFVWIYDIVEWVKDLSAQTANDSIGETQTDDSEFGFKFACGTELGVEQEPDNDNDGIPDEEDSAPYSMDDDGDGIPDGANQTVALDLEWDEDRILFANGADFTTVTVTALDSNGDPNTADSASTVGLEITSGENYGAVVSLDGVTLIDGSATLTLVSTQEAGTFTLQAVGLDGAVDGLTSNELSITSKIRRLKLSTYEKTFITQDSTYTTETVEDVLVLDENGTVVAIVHAADGAIDVLDAAYRLEARQATASSPTRFVLIETATGVESAQFYIYPDVNEALILSSSSELESTMDAVRVIDSNPSDEWTAEYLEAEGGSIVLKVDDDWVGLVDPDGSVYLKPGLVLTLTPADPFDTVDNVQMHFTVNLGEQTLFDVVLGSTTTFLDMVVDEATDSDEETGSTDTETISWFDHFKGWMAQAFHWTASIAQAAIDETHDADGDNLDDLSEWTIGTDLYDVDTDDDSFADSIELENGYDPLGAGALFSDLNPSHEAYSAVIVLYTRGIVSGYSDGSFKPDQSISREEFTKLNLGAVCIDCTQFTTEMENEILSEYSENPFPDTDLSDGLYACVAYSKNEGLISGYKSEDFYGYYLPTTTMSRAEATKVLLKTVGISVPDTNDLGLPWYYDYVVEAQNQSLYPEGRFEELDSLSSSEFEPWLSTELSKNGSIKSWLEAPITRAEFAMMVVNLQRLQNCAAEDSDGDGLPDNSEIYNYGTSPYNADTDYGGVDDFTELVNNTNAISNPSDDSLAQELSESGTSSGEVPSSTELDTDGDGLTDDEETNYGTDPASPDTDGDGLTDYEEVEVYDTDPLDPDTDDGGVGDFEEVVRGTDALNETDDDDYGSSDGEGATVQGSNLSRDYVYQTESITDSVLIEQNLFTKLVPADGTSQLYLRATILDEDDNPVIDDDSSIVEFVAVDPAYPYAEILREQVRVTDGIAETELLASTTSGYFAITATITPTSLPVIDTSVYVYPGDPYYLEFESQSNFLKSGGLNATDVELRLYDYYGNVASMSPQTVTLEADGPLSLDETLDEDPEQNGIQVTLYEGTLTFRVISGEDEGEATLTASLGELETQVTIGVYDDIALEIQAANDQLTANGTATTTLTVWAVLDGSGVPLEGFSGEATFSVADDLYGSLPETTTVSMVDGQAEIDFTASTVSGTGTVSVAMLGFEPASIDLTLLPGESETLELSSLVSDIAVGETVEVTVKAFDDYGNWVYTDASTEVELRVTELGSSFGSISTDSLTLSNGSGTFEVTAADLTGPINLVASGDGLDSATLTLNSVLEVPGESLESMSPNTLFAALLGGAFGEITQDDYFAGWYTFSGKTQAAVSLLSDPNPKLRLASLHPDGAVRVLDGNAIDVSIVPANSPDLPTKFLVKDLRTSQTVLEGAVVTDETDFYLISADADLADSLVEDGYYIQLLSVDDRYTVKQTTAKAGLSSGRFSGLGMGSGETRVSLVEEDNEIVRFEADGQIQIFNPDYELQLNEDYPGLAFDVTLGDAPIARVVWKQTFEEGVIELDQDFDWAQWDLLDPGIYFKGVESEVYGFTASYSGHSSKNPQGLFVVDKTQEMPSKQKPGLGFSSLEKAGDETGIGFKGDNKFMLFLSDGMTVGEANLPYASDIGILLGDPTIRLTDVNPLDVSSTGFTSGIGRMIVAGNETIQDLSVIDYNSDGLEDVMVAFEDGLIQILENTNGYPRFEDKGDLLNITNGIVAMEQADFNQDGQIDLVIATQESCVEGEICIYQYTNNEASFVRENLNLELEGNGINIKDIVAEDLNQDDYPDLVVSDLNGSIFVYYNAGGTFLSEGDNIGNVGLQVDDDLNLLEELLFHYEGMPEDNPLDASDDDDFKSFSIPVETDASDHFESAFGDPDPAFPTGGFSTNFVDEILGSAGDGVSVTVDNPSVQEEVTYVYADADPAFITSSKTAEDVNGGILEDGDLIEYTLELENTSGATIADLSLTDVVSSLVELDWDSFECRGTGCQAMTVAESSSGTRPFIITGLNLYDNEPQTITYQATVSGMQTPAVQLVIGQDLDSSYTDDSYADIGATPEDNPSGQMVFFYSNGTYTEQGVRKINYTKWTSPAEDPVDLSDTFEEAGIDLTDLDEDGNPTALHIDSDAEEPPDAVNGPYEDVAHSESESAINELWSNTFTPVENPGDIITNAAAGLASAEATILMADAVVSEVADGIESILTQFLCSGGCIAIPINYAFLVPGPINVMGIPVSPMDPLHIPIFAAPVPSIVPLWPPTPAWQASTAVRIYASITLTLGFTISVCVGPYLAGQCWTISIPLFEALGVCDAINGALSSAISKASSFISEGANKLMSFGGGGGQSGDSRSESGGIVNYNLGSYLVAAGGSENQLVPGFPAFFAEWGRKQLAEITDLADLPDITLYYPDVSSFVTTAFIPDKETLKDADLRGMEKVLSYINSIPLLRIETEEVNFRFPALTKEEIDMTIIEFSQWLDYHTHLWDQVKENWENSTDQSVQNVVDEINTLFRTMEKNLETLEDYKDFPRELLKWRYVEAYYAKQIVCYLDTIINWMGGWLIKNTQRIEQWIQAVYDLIEALKSWKLLFDLFIDFQESCDQCKNQRLSLFELLLKLFVFIPEPPIIDLPKLPDIVLDFSQIQAGVTIVWPDLTFTPEPLLIPDLPTIPIPELPVLDLDLPAIPELPALPALPELPALPGIPLPDLPDLPPPPELPGLPNSIQVMIKIGKGIMKIICLIQSGIIPTQETSLKTQVENMTQRPLSPVLPLDFNISFPSLNLGKDFVDVIEVVTVLNLSKALEFDGLVELVQVAADASNSIVTDLVQVVNESAQGVSDTVQSTVDAGSDAAGAATDSELDIDLDSEASAAWISSLSTLDSEALRQDLITQTAQSLLDEPVLAPYFSQWDLAVQNIETDAQTQAALNAEIPEQYTLQATSHFVAFTPEEIESHYATVEDQYLAGTLSTLKDSPLPSLRDDFLAYVMEEQDQTAALAELLNNPDHGWDEMTRWIAHNETSSFEPTESRLLVGSTPSAEDSSTLYSTEYSFLDLRETLLTELANSSVIVPTLESVQSSSDRYLASSTSESSDSVSEARSAGEVMNVGIFLYNEEEEVNERLIDYTAEADEPTLLAFLDMEDDGDDDIVYSMGGSVYLKENYTENEAPTYYDEAPEILDLESLLPEAPMVDLFRSTGSGNEVASVSWRPSGETVAGYELQSFVRIPDFEETSADEVYWDHFLIDDPYQLSPDSLEMSGSATVANLDYTEDAPPALESFAANVAVETSEDSELALTYDSSSFTLASDTLFAVPIPEISAVTLSDIEGSATLSENQRLRTLVFDSGSTEVYADEIIHSLETTELSLTLAEGGSIAITLEADHLFAIPSLYTDPVTLRVESGSIEILGESTSEEAQTLVDGMLLLPEESVTFEEEITVTLTSSTASHSTTYGGPGVYTWHELSNPDVPQFLLDRENGDYYAHLRSITEEGLRGTWGDTVLLSPQICADEDPPYANLGDSTVQVSVFKTTTLDGSGSFDSDSDALSYWWDYNLTHDSDSDGDPTNDPNIYRDNNPLADTDGDGNFTNDWSDPDYTVGPYETLDTREFKLWVSDEAGNATGAQATVEVYVPDIAISASAGRTGIVEGSIDPADSDIPFVLIRERDGVYDLITTPTADENSKYYTDENGEFTIDDLNLSEAWVVYNAAHEAVAAIDPDTGAMVLLDDTYRVEVTTAELPWPTRVALIDSFDRPLLYIFFVPDANVDVTIDVTSLEYTRETTEDLYGVHVKPVQLPEGYDLVSIPANEPLFTGGAALVDDSGQRLALFDTDGNIYRLTDFDLGVKHVETVTSEADVEDAEPIVLTLGRDGSTWVEIFLSTEDASTVLDSSGLEVTSSELATLEWPLGTHATGGTEDGSYLSSLDPSADTDDDGITDLIELQTGLNPYDASDANEDADGDGLSNFVEATLDTDLLNTDSDGDGFSDAEEVATDHNPNSSEESYFGDIDSEDPLYQDILDLVQLGILSGYEEDGEINFHPDDFITRAEYTKILLGILCIIPRDEAYTLPIVFNDITDTSLWYYPITKESFLQTFITGYLGEIDAEGLTPFKPEITISRAEGTKIILEALEVLGVIDMGEVTIPEGSPWYVPYLGIAQDLSPYATGEFLGEETPYLLTSEEAGRATEALTRYDFVLMATRVLDFYNCYAIQDSDGDGLSDYTEVNETYTDENNSDTDGDGLSDYDEVETYGTNPNDPDTDDGGIHDGEEVDSGADPLDPSDDDSDGDGLTDAEERTVYGTNPYEADTDGGGVTDGAEVDAGTDPVDDATDDGSFGTDEETLETSVIEDDNILDDLSAGMTIVIPECNACPCDVSIENTADLMEGDTLYASIMNTANTVVLSISSGVPIEDLTP